MSPIDHHDVASAFPELTIQPGPPLGSGGFKDAFRAQLDGEDVVLKVIREPVTSASEGEVTLPERARREITAMKSVRSPRVVSLLDGPDVRDIGEQERVWFLEPYYPGGTLRARRYRAHTDQASLALLSDLIDGIEAMMRASLVHRDIKPDNIVLDGEGRPVLLDLGIALHQHLTQLTHDGAPGPLTRMYAAPEQFMPRGKATIDFRTDLFCAGAVCFEVRTGRHPYDHGDQDYEYNLFQGRLNDAALKQANVSHSVSKLLARLLAPEMSKRFRKLDFVRRAIDGCQ